MKTEILIVGAGPAGLSAAKAACDAGVDTLVIEKSNEIGHPVHTSGGSWVKEMRKFGVPEKYYNPIRNTIFSSPSHDAEFSLRDNMGCILHVRPFYQYLATEAISKGASLSLSTTARSIVKESKDLITVKASRFGKTISISARMCIDCSGFPAVIGKSIGLVDGWKRYGFGAEYEAWVENVDRSTSILLVGEDVAPAGYAWIFPLGEHRARIGVGVIRPDVNRNPLNLLNKLLRKPTRHVKSLGRIVPLEFHIGNTPADGPVRRSACGRVLLAGDAAGQVIPHVGEGIRFAISFGRMAGDIAASVVAEQDLTKAGLYDKKWKSTSAKKFSLALRIQHKLTTLTDEEWDHGAEILKSLSSKEFVNLIRWDITGRFLVGLIARHPTLASSRTLRLLFKSLWSNKDEGVTKH